MQEVPLSVKTWRWCQQADWGLGVAKDPGVADCVAFKAVKQLWLSISMKHTESRNKDNLLPFLVWHPSESVMPCSCILYLRLDCSLLWLCSSVQRSLPWCCGWRALTGSAPYAMLWWSAPTSTSTLRQSTSTLRAMSVSSVESSAALLRPCLSTDQNTSIDE